MIDLQNVSFSYLPTKPLFEGLSLRVECGGVGLVMGANGVGKTTLLKLIAGLLTPTAGSVKVGHYNAHLRCENFLRDMFFVPDEFAMPRSATAIQFGRGYGYFYPGFSEGEFMELLGKLGVKPDEKLASLSFGSRKKAFLAFAIACNTQYLLLDEPTNGLDPGSKAELLSLLASLASDNRTIVIASHHVGDLNMLMDRVMVLDEGIIKLNATYGELSSALTFGAIDPGKAIYCTSSISGTRGVGLNTNGGDSVVDLDLLYSAVRSNSRFFETFNFNNSPR